MRIVAASLCCLLISDFALGAAPGAYAARLAKFSAARLAKDDATYVGVCSAPRGSIFRREGPGKPWKLTIRNEKLQPGNLLVGMPRARIRNMKETVRIQFGGEPGWQGAFPVLEPALTLNANPKVDVDLTLDRGRIELFSTNAKGPATVLLRVENKTWKLTLAKKDTWVAIELYGRWPAGVVFRKDPKPDHKPNKDMVFLILRGEMELEHDSVVHAMKPPPGPTVIHWNSVTGQEETPQTMTKLPEWATANEEIKKRHKAGLEKLRKFRRLMVQSSIGNALDTFVKSDDAQQRMIAVFIAAGLDDLTRVRDFIFTTKHEDVWNNGVLALRHWIGRGPGQDQLLYQRILKAGKLTQPQAEIVMQLLHSFSATQLSQHETYEMLLDMMQHEQRGIRGLAYWHMYRLVPEGRKFGYHPLGPKEERAKAMQLWLKLVPPGKLPPKPMASEKE